MHAFGCVCEDTKRGGWGGGDNVAQMWSPKGVERVWLQNWVTNVLLNTAPSSTHHFGV